MALNKQHIIRCVQSLKSFEKSTNMTNQGWRRKQPDVSNIQVGFTLQHNNNNSKDDRRQNHYLQIHKNPKAHLKTDNFHDRLEVLCSNCHVLCSSHAKTKMTALKSQLNKSTSDRPNKSAFLSDFTVFTQCFLT